MKYKATTGTKPNGHGENCVVFRRGGSNDGGRSGSLKGRTTGASPATVISPTDIGPTPAIAI